jgi:hypothetical protein
MNSRRLVKSQVCGNPVFFARLGDFLLALDEMALMI